MLTLLLIHGPQRFDIEVLELGHLKGDQARSAAKYEACIRRGLELAYTPKVIDRTRFYLAVRKERSGW